MSKDIISIVVPCHNEEEMVPIFHKEITAVSDQLPDAVFELIFVNDGSKDATLAELKRLASLDERVHYLSFSRNFGKEAAMLAGMKMSDAEYVGILDADLQHSPNLIPDMMNVLINEDYDIAAARRIDRKGEAKLKSVFSKQFYKLINKISDTGIEDGAQDFRIMKRKVVDAIISMPEYNRFSKGIFSWVGFKTKWFEHENNSRVAGETKWSFWKLLRYALDGIIGFSTAPLKISLYIGSAFSLIGIVYAIYIFIRTLIYGSDVPGYPSLICAVFVIGGLILLSLGVAGEYISRIYLEVKNRPIYIVDETNIIPKFNEKNK